MQVRGSDNRAERAQSVVRQRGESGGGAAGGPAVEAAAGLLPGQIGHWLPVRLVVKGRCAERLVSERATALMVPPDAVPHKLPDLGLRWTAGGGGEKGVGP